MATKDSKSGRGGSSAGAQPIDAHNEIRARIEIESEDFTVTPDETGAYTVRFHGTGDEGTVIGLFVEEGGGYVFRFAQPRSADVLIEDDDCKELIRVIQKAGQFFEAQAEQKV